MYFSLLNGMNSKQKEQGSANAQSELLWNQAKYPLLSKQRIDLAVSGGRILVPLTFLHMP